MENGDIQTFYGDLLKDGAPIDSMVKTGDVIGLIGSSGPGSTGPHLQYAVRVKGSWVDPLPILEAGGAIFRTK